MSGNTQHCKKSLGKRNIGATILNYKKNSLDFLSALGPHLAGARTTRESGAWAWIFDPRIDLGGSLAGHHVSGPPSPRQQNELFRPLLRAL